MHLEVIQVIFTFLVGISADQPSLFWEEIYKYFYEAINLGVNRDDRLKKGGRKNSEKPEKSETHPKYDGTSLNAKST